MCGRLIQNREGVGLIVGDQGTGKSTIMRRFTSLMRNVCMVEEEQVVAMT